MISRLFSWIAEVWKDMDGEFLLAIAVFCTIGVLIVSISVTETAKEASDNDYRWAKSWIGHYQEFDERLAEFMVDERLNVAEMATLKKLLKQLEAAESNCQVKQELLDAL